MKRGQEGRQRDAARPLDVVVEAGYLLAVFVQDPLCVLQAEVFTGGLSAYPVRFMLKVRGWKGGWGHEKAYKWMYALGNLFLADHTNLSTKSSYCFPLTRGFRSPRYSSSLRRVSF